MYESEQFESASEPGIGYEAPQVEDVEACATAEVAPAALPLSLTD